MSRQVNFYLSSKDSALVRGVVMSCQPAVMLSRYPPTAKNLLLSDADRGDALADIPSFYVARTPDLAHVRYLQVPAQGYWRVDPWNSPVVEFSNCHREPGTIHRGRLYAVTRYFEGEEPVHKDPAFLDWVDRVLRRVKSVLELRDGDYLGPEAVELVSAGTTRLIGH